MSISGQTIAQVVKKNEHPGWSNVFGRENKDFKLMYWSLNSSSDWSQSSLLSIQNLHFLPQSWWIDFCHRQHMFQQKADKLTVSQKNGNMLQNLKELSVAASACSAVSRCTHCFSVIFQLILLTDFLVLAVFMHIRGFSCEKADYFPAFHLDSLSVVLFQLMTQRSQRVSEWYRLK